ncbi:MAG: MerR family transcriptional regulator [Anaerolineae bacterium]|nr:MerR family transcriptional regulator [Anaerolineae bacterium]
MDETRYHIHEFARLAGVTVRTLHFYDRAGLLKPARASGGARPRLYAAADLLRLQQILTLKYLGFSLREIHTLLHDPAYDVRDSLRLQKAAIDRRILQMQHVSYALAQTLEKLDGGRAIDWQQVIAVVQGLTAADKADWLARYFPPDRADWLHERSVQMPPAAVQAGAAAWDDLYADFRRHSHLPAHDPQVQALAAQMHTLIVGFTGGDPALEDGLRALYHDPAALPAAYRPAADDSVLHDFMQQALTLYRQQKGATS